MDDFNWLHSRIEMVPIAGCWLWTGTLNAYGYGVVNSGTNMVGVHRVVFGLLKGEIPDGAHVLHRCDVRCCCNPDHLFLGDQTINMRDKTNKGRQRKGEGVPQSKLKLAQISEIKIAYATGDFTQSYLASVHGVDQSEISRIVNNKAWKHAQGEKNCQ